MKKLLVVNAGSSSMKYRLYSKDNKQILADGLAERIFVDGKITIKIKGIVKTKNIILKNHLAAVLAIMDLLKKYNVIKNTSEIVGIGHRVVQGGEYFKESSLIDAEALKKIEDIQDLAPLHNPAEIDVIKSFQKMIPNAKNVAVFDTAFHQTMPKQIFLYGVPYHWYQKYYIRKYGMHGTSHYYITLQVEKFLKKKPVNIISAHLGNGASITAIKNSKSYNTSMGLTPLAGIIMGTRSGDLDPAVIEYMCKQTNKSVEDITALLNKKSGVLGLSGISSDLRDIETKYHQGHKLAKLAIDIYTKRIADVIAQYQNDLENQVDAIVFTAGVGENSSLVRKKVIEQLHTFNFEFNNKENETRKSGIQELTTPNSNLKILKIPTNEELMIVNDLITKANL